MDPKPAGFSSARPRALDEVMTALCRGRPISPACDPYLPIQYSSN